MEKQRFPPLFTRHQRTNLYPRYREFFHNLPTTFPQLHRQGTYPQFHNAHAVRHTSYPTYLKNIDVLFFCILCVRLCALGCVVCPVASECRAGRDADRVQKTGKLSDILLSDPFQSMSRQGCGLYVLRMVYTISPDILRGLRDRCPV